MSDDANFNKGHDQGNAQEVDNPKTSTTNSTPSLIHLDQHLASSRRMQNLTKVRGVFEQIGQGKSPTNTFADDTCPKYWIIRTGDGEFDGNIFDQNCEDQWSLEDQRSKDEHELWVRRGGQGVGLRFGANCQFGCLIDHAAMRLVDGASGNSCVGVNFVARHVDKTNKQKNKDNDEEKGRRRCFMLVEDELSRNPEKLLKRLRMRKVVGSLGQPLSLGHLKNLLRKAPVLIVMPDVGIDPVFWEPHALQEIVDERRRLSRLS
jgi:hypothetical protein